MSTVRVSLNQAEINNLLHGPTGPVRLFVEAAAGEVYFAALGTVPRRTGVLASSLDIDDRSNAREVSFAVGTDRMRGYWTNVGNGPGPIRPKKSKFLKFNSSRSGRPVYKRQVAAYQGNMWLYTALQVLQGRFLVRRDRVTRPVGSFRV